MPFSSRLTIVSALFVGATYCVALPGEPMPVNSLALLFLPVIPFVSLAGPVGLPLSLFTIPTVLIAVCCHVQRRRHLLLVGATMGIINGLVVRWCLWFAHGLAT